MSNNPLSNDFIDYRKIILNGCININQAKEFKKLEFKQHSKNYWFPNPNLDEVILRHNLPTYNLVPWNKQLADFDIVISVIDLMNDTYSAYTFEELISFIPKYVFTANDIVLNDYFLNDNKMTIIEWLADKYLEILRKD